MKTWSELWGAAAAAIAAAAVLWACNVSFPDGSKFTCEADEDCGEGFRCLVVDGSAPYCCAKGSAGCDALADAGTDGGTDAGTTAACSGVDLTTNPANCGSCGHACTAEETCRISTCVSFVESNCSDGIDNDLDGSTDCADPDCQGLSCGTGCLCNNGGKAETLCSDGLDNDSDSFIDCADPNCQNFQSCGNGCVCKPSGVKSEVFCTDKLDNDGDGLVDCSDILDCTPGTTCAAGKKCLADAGCG